MKNGARNTWMLAALAVMVGAGELAARGLAPHAEAMLASDPARAALKAGSVVARNVAALVADRARDAAGTVVLGAVRGTARIQRLALGVLETAGRGSHQASRPTVAPVMANVNPVHCELTRERAVAMTVSVDRAEVRRCVRAAVAKHRAAVAKHSAAIAKDRAAAKGCDKAAKARSRVVI